MDEIVGEIISRDQGRVGSSTHSARRRSPPVICSDTNWHTILYLIRINLSIAAGSSSAYAEPAVVSKDKASDDGLFLLRRSQTLLRNLADDIEKGRKERGFLLGLLEIARECRLRGWEEGESCSERIHRILA